MSLAAPQKKRKSRHLFAWIGHGAVGFVLKQIFNADWFSDNPPVQIAVGVGVAVWVAVIVAQWRRARRESREARRLGRWPTGRSHGVQIDLLCDGKREPGTLVFRDAGLDIDPSLESMPDATPFEDVTVVRVRRTEIEIESTGWKIRVVPANYESRERLLWELALRCNEAVERGIDEAAAGKAKPSTARPAKFEDGLDPTGLDRAATGLGSALAGPMSPRNPAPPRKSGLGVGLFPAPGE